MENFDSYGTREAAEMAQSLSNIWHYGQPSSNICPPTPRMLEIIEQALLKSWVEVFDRWPTWRLTPDGERALVKAEERAAQREQELEAHKQAEREFWAKEGIKDPAVIEELVEAGPF